MKRTTVITVLLLAGTACGPSKEDLARATSLMKSREMESLVENSLERSCKREASDLTTKLIDDHIRTGKVNGVVVSRDESAKVILEASGRGKHCAEYSLQLDKSSKARRELEEFCSSNLEACERVRRLQAAVR